MSDVRLNASRVLRIAFSDTVPIPSISTKFVSGSASATTVNKLVDSTKNFVALGVKKGHIIYNTTDNTAALVTAVDSATTLSVSADVFALGETYDIYASEEGKGVTIFVGNQGVGNGDIKITTGGGDTVTVSGLVTGAVIPILTKKVFATGTTITVAYALW